MAVLILSEGGAIPPSRPGPLLISATSASGARLELQKADGEIVPPSQRLTDDSFILQPSAVTIMGEVTVVATRVGGGPFTSGTKLGVTVTHPSRPVDDMVVLNPVDASGRSSARLVRLSANSGSLLLHDAFNAAIERGARSIQQRSWHERGRYAFHASHANGLETAGQWSMVVDGSATLLAPSRRAAIGELLETVYGVMVADRDGGPNSVRVTKLGASVDIQEALDGDELDWASILGDRPSPWSAVLPAIKEAAADIDHQGVIALVVDGVPTDALELVAWVDQAPAGLTVRIVGVGRSRFEALAQARPNHWWDEEFAALEPIAHTGRHTLVTLSDESTAAQAATSLAAGMTAGGRLIP